MVKYVIGFGSFVWEFQRMDGNDTKGPLFSRFSKIGLCVGLEIFF
jgi:hypothetical protein